MRHAPATTFLCEACRLVSSTIGRWLSFVSHRIYETTVLLISESYRAMRGLKEFQNDKGFRVLIMPRESQLDKMNQILTDLSTSTLVSTLDNIHAVKDLIAGSCRRFLLRIYISEMQYRLIKLT